MPFLWAQIRHLPSIALGCAVAGLLGCSQSSYDAATENYQGGQQKAASSQAKVETDYTLGGFITGVSGTIDLSLNGEIEQFTAGPFNFAQTLEQNDRYLVEFITTDTGQSCRIDNAQGTVNNSIGDINILCAPAPIYLQFTDATPVGPVSAGDFNQDGHQDLAASLLTTTGHPLGANRYVMRFMWGASNGSFSTVEDQQVARHSFNWFGHSAMTATLSNDQDDDLALVTKTGLKQFIGWIGGPISLNNAVFFSGMSKTYIADANLDGRNDVIAMSYTPGQADDNLLCTFAGNGNATFNAPMCSGFFEADPAAPNPDPGYIGEPNIVVAPFAGDGLPHVAAIFIQGGQPVLGLFENDGSGYFNYPAQINALPVDVYDSDSVFGRHPMTAGDIDNDGDVDLAIASTHDFVLLLTNEGNGVFLPHQRITMAQQPSQLALVDLDLDDELDLISLNQGSPSLTIAWGVGSGRFGQRGDQVNYSDRPLEPESVFGEMVIADLDANDFPDIVFVERNIETNTASEPGSVQVLLNVGPSH